MVGHSRHRSFSGRLFRRRDALRTTDATAASRVRVPLVAAGKIRFVLDRSTSMIVYVIVSRNSEPFGTTIPRSMEISSVSVCKGSLYVTMYSMFVFECTMGTW